MFGSTWSLQKWIYVGWGAIASFLQNIQTAMVGLLICMVIDTITGFIAAPYRKNADGTPQLRESHKLRKLVPKIITYFIATAVLHICEHMILPSYLEGMLELSRMALTIFSAIEIYSILENLRDITKLHAFDVLTLNFRKQIESRTGLDTKGKDSD